jgi:hypothetical protein
MSTAFWSDTAKQLQFDAIADLFKPGKAWVAMVFETMNDGVRQQVEEQRYAVPYTREKRALVFDLPSELRHSECQYDGWIIGCRIYVRKKDADPICLAPFVGNTNMVTPGSIIDIGRLVLDVP